MKVQTFPVMTKAYLLSVIGLISLVIVAVDDNDCKDADDIRDRLDEPWYAMTDLERTAVRQLSAELG